MATSLALLPGNSSSPLSVVAATSAPEPVRRASWLNDASPSVSQPQGLARKWSFASASMSSPTTSHPTTPSADAGTWGPSRTHQGTAPFRWPLNGIWNNDRKDPPLRLSEVLPSPTSALSSGASAALMFSSEIGVNQAASASRESGHNSQIPFPIPLYPTPKTYRSQSYSVGQLEPDAANLMTTSVMHGAGRRAIPHSGLQHRPSRPSMLSEMSNELQRVKEVDDDNEENDSVTSRDQLNAVSEAHKTIELLTRENAILKQQQQYQSLLRPRASTSSYGLGGGYSHSPVPEESESAIDELDESGEGLETTVRRATLTRRMSEYGVGTAAKIRTPYAVENRKLENVKKATWQSSLGFTGLGEISQSRRHSFADVQIPTRQGSISSMSDAVLAGEQKPLNQEPLQIQDYGTSFGESPTYQPGNTPSTYFTGGHSMGSPQQAIGQSSFNSPFPSPYSMHMQYSHRPPSPHRAMYAMSQPRHNQPLYIVLFKFVRADVFYIQEGTGLEVKTGDLVIVEADRGTDLGTVAKAKVDWQAAKELKEHYAEEHYKWLMMYSNNAADAQEKAGGVISSSSNGLHGSIGGIGPAGPQHVQEPNSGELKPKLIKRLAQSHEVFGLRDKEANEAKAKRVCMQKVKEHGLNMEILDAEFQMDWKKLTFYYYADAYINFNPLVTDLFKTYKTRIWMSAVNPASYASSTLGIQAPSGIGPGAVGVNRGAGTAERLQNQPQEQPNAYTSPAPAIRNFQSSPFPQQYGTDRTPVQSSPYQQNSYPYSGGQFGSGAFSGISRPMVPQYGRGMPQPMESYSSNSFSQTSGDYASMRSRYAGSQVSGQDRGLGGQPEWMNQFQGLSLNSR